MDTLRWNYDRLEILDQTLLPQKAEYINCREVPAVCEAICRLSVRGAPAIGAAAAYGLALGARNIETVDKDEFINAVDRIAAELNATRPTAVNLKWALDRMMDLLRRNETGDVIALKKTLLDEAHAIYREDLAGNRLMGEYGQALVPQKAAILTHCNAGALATAGLGTALGVIRAARDAGKDVIVFADETRPLLQGARLTTWEMLQEKIPVTLVTDNMAGFLMAKGMVDLVIVGADRIAGNGDVANKIGTYGVAVLAGEHGIPFYVAAPMSTIDFNISSGAEIPIEERDPQEVTHFAGVRVAPEGIKVWNPAFDVTPARLVTAIITDRGVAYPPYIETLAAMNSRGVPCKCAD